jgi:hypothetical protein
VNPPRWFYALAAVCLVVLTAASAYALLVHARSGRWVYAHLGDVNRDAALDTQTGRFCLVSGECIGPATFARPAP